MRDPHRLFGALHPVLHQRRLGHLHRDHSRLAAAVQRLEARERQHHEPVPRLAEDVPLLRDHAFHAVLRAEDADFLPDRLVGVVEQAVGDIEPERRDRAALPDVHVAERLARGELVVLHQLERRGDAEDEGVAHRLVAPHHVGLRGGPAGLDGDRLRVGEGALDIVNVFGRDDRPALDLLPLLVVDQPHGDRGAPHLERVDAHDRAADPLAHVGVHALDHGHHRHQERDRHDDAEQREERAELVAPRGM